MADIVEKHVYTKHRIGAQDINFGIGTEIQIRNGKRVEVKWVDSSDIPYEQGKSVKEILDELVAKVGL